MFKNAIIFRIHAASLPAVAALEDELHKRRFAPCGASQMESYGWVPPRGEKNGPLLESVSGQHIMHLMTESKILPGAVVKEQLSIRLAKIEADTGRRPKGKLAKQIKEEVIAALLPKAFTSKKKTRLWVCPAGKFIVVEAGTPKSAERIISELCIAFSELDSDIAVTSLNTLTSPSAAMSTWLTTQEPPEAFTVDRECELKSEAEEKASVRYTRHTLDIKEIVEHISQGKIPTKLALTHDGRVSFMLADNLSLKKIEILDVVTEDAGADKSGFDADVAIFTGEMMLLIPDLVKALGGEESED